ncbi:MAG: CapA family protein [bacterium]
MPTHPRHILVISLFFLAFLSVAMRFGMANLDAANVSEAASTSDVVVPIVAPLPPVHRSIHLMFVGDMMFDRAVRKTINSKGYDFVFGDAKKLFDKTQVGGPDLVVGNLEGSITTFKSKTLQRDGSTGNAPLDFTFATATAPALKSAGVDVVSLANNHSANRGEIGLTLTRHYLTDAGVDFFGDPGNLAGHSIVKCIDVKRNMVTASSFKSFCIGLIGYHEFAYKNADNIISDIQELKKTTNIVIVMPHWGIEYQKTPTKFQRDLAHTWIDAGADIIIGAHPHIVESIEEYNGHTIFYSLGNFIFDQYFSFDTTHGMAVDISIPDDYTASSTLAFDLIPIENKHTVMSLPDATTTNRILQDLAHSSKKYVGTSTLQNILGGKI